MKRKEKDGRCAFAAGSREFHASPRYSFAQNGVSIRKITTLSMYDYHCTTSLCENVGRCESRAKSMLSFSRSLEGLSPGPVIVVLLAAARDKKDGSPNARRRGLLRPSLRRSIYAVRRLGKKRGEEDLIHGEVQQRFHPRKG